MPKPGNPLHTPLTRPLRRCIRVDGVEWLLYLKPGDPGYLGLKMKGARQKETVWIPFDQLVESARRFNASNKLRAGS